MLQEWCECGVVNIVLCCVALLRTIFYLCQLNSEIESQKTLVQLSCTYQYSGSAGLVTLVMEII